MMWWYGRLPIAETLILVGFARILYELVFAVTGWPVHLEDLLFPLAVVAIGFIIRARRLRYP
jgi:hypothetical protein